MEHIARRIHILNSPVDTLSMDETVSIIEKAIISRRPLRHTAVNAAKLVNMQKNKELFKSVTTSDLINADGQSVVWAARFLGKHALSRVTGIELMQKLVELANIKKYKVFLLGAREEVVSKVAGIYSNMYSPEIIVGYHNGYFDRNEEEHIAELIAKSKADMLFVAITSPKKEIFLKKYEHIINVPFIMGVGGSFDVVAGVTKRAPRWMQKICMEWFFRFLQEPGRMWKRYLVTNTLFIYYVFKAKFRSKRYA